MKKILILMIVGIILTGWMMPAISYAQGQQTVKPAELFKVETSIGEGKSLGNLQGLQKTTDVGGKAEDFPKFYAAVTKILLGAASVLVVVGFFSAGVVYLSAQGNEETIKKAKNILLYTLLGILIIAAAYGITYGIAQLKLS
ncbi:hypothetical protein HZA39_00570 [Candidatus Peregrinibacteria bacterium]|nr:hypothetical protein [Candidatus Peregrinibacteria bacterium]